MGISVENLVHPGFANLAYLQPFDAAIVINHSPHNLAGITTMSEGKLTFSERPGLDALQKNLQAVLSNETTLTETHGDLESESMANLLFDLANHGRMLFDAIENEIGSLDRDAGRIQVVEARAGAFFPIEFIYPIPVPQERPPMCPHAKAALADPDIHHVCANHNDENFMCPMRFWGFRKIIERQPPSNSSTDKGEVQVPAPFNAKLDLFRCAQVAKSASVRPEDYDLPDGVLNVLEPAFNSLQSDFVKWKKWKDMVELESPTFLLLLSHSAKGVAGLPALEIGGDLLGIASIESAYVKGPHTDSPVLFILGCSTADPNIGFLNYVERFKKKNAALVVGTLSIISGRRATMFLKLAIPILKAASGSGKTFGEVFLELKRSMLANGDGFVTSLVAYGEIDWQL
jgi:hypothetical protein